MSCQLQINDLISRLRNSRLSSIRSCKVKKSKLSESCLSIMKENFFILDYYVTDDGLFFLVDINYDFNDKNPFSESVVVTKPSRQAFLTLDKLKKSIVKDKNRFGLISTSSGIMTVESAIKRGLGGELLFFI